MNFKTLKMKTLYKILLVVISITVSYNSFSQLKVQNDGRIGMGSILTPPVSNKVSIYASNREVPLCIYGVDLLQWSQVNKTIVDEADVLSNVVHRLDPAGNKDVFYVNGNGDIFYRFGWIPDLSHYNKGKSNAKIDNPIEKVMKLNGIILELEDNDELIVKSSIHRNSLGLTAENVESVFQSL